MTAISLLLTPQANGDPHCTYGCIQMFLRASAEVPSVREAAAIRRNWDDWPHCSECHYVNEDLVRADKGYDG